MPTTSIRIDGTVLIVLRELARQQHQSIQTVLATAIETYRRQRFSKTPMRLLQPCGKTRRRGQRKRKNGSFGIGLSQTGWTANDST